jgi:hypothetical protein
MFNFGKFIKSKMGMDILSIILGLGLASIFKISCNHRNCLIHKVGGDLKQNVLKYNDKCYKAKEKSVSCDDSKEIIEFN